MTKDDIKEAIASIPDLSDEDLIHYTKCALSKEKPAEKAMLKPLLLAIEKARRKRGTVTTITKAIAPKAIQHANGAKPDDY